MGIEPTTLCLASMAPQKRARNDSAVSNCIYLAFYQKTSLVINPDLSLLFPFRACQSRDRHGQSIRLRGGGQPGELGGFFNGEIGPDWL